MYKILKFVYYYINTKGGQKLGKETEREASKQYYIYIYPSSFGEIYKNKVEMDITQAGFSQSKQKGIKKYGSS